MGLWYTDLTRGRRDASAEITQKTVALAASGGPTLANMQALARFLQHDIRYVGIELGIGGYQPHSAADVFAHKYGDCKDKATLMSSMLKSIGVDSYYVVINTERGSVTPEMPAHMGGFDHAILAIKLPDGVADPSLVAVMRRPKLGRLLFFDPTDELTPFGSLRPRAAGGLWVAGDARRRRAHRIAAASRCEERDPAHGEADAYADRHADGRCEGNSLRRFRGVPALRPEVR